MVSMILVGDIGGTKTVLALCPEEAGLYDIRKSLCHERQFACATYGSLEDILDEYLSSLDSDSSISSACFGVAGPIVQQTARITNLPWIVDAANIAARFHFTSVYLLNDLEALAQAVPALGTKGSVVLRRGKMQAGAPMAVVAPGTGLGVASLLRGGEEGTGGDFSDLWDYRACACEAGHMSFAPRNALQIELLAFLLQDDDHISYEKVCSGSAIPQLYRFLRDHKGMTETPWLYEQLRVEEDVTPTILALGLAPAKEQTEICRAVVTLFLDILATVISDISLAYLPSAGIFLGGGLPPRLLSLLQEEAFLDKTARKGRFSDLCRSIPLSVITQRNPGLVGAVLWMQKEKGTS